MKIYTKKGDQGQTSLIGGTRVSKHSLRIESYGTIDELNSYIGLIADQKSAISFYDILSEIQKTLFVIGSHLANDSAKSKMTLPEIKSDFLELLESEIDKMESSLPELLNFILPGGSTSVSFCHIARCVCRRAERNVVHLSTEIEIEPIIIQALNRLSDYLFVLGRKLGQIESAPERLWIP